MSQYLPFIFIFSLSLSLSFSTYAQNSCKEIFKISSTTKTRKAKTVTKSIKKNDPLELSGTLTAA